MSWWPNLNKPTKIAIISGAFALVTAIIGVAVPLIVSHCRKQADLQILDITPVLVGSMPAVDVLLKNKADVPN